MSRASCASGSRYTLPTINSGELAHVFKTPLREGGFELKVDQLARRRLAEAGRNQVTDLLGLTVQADTAKKLVPLVSSNPRWYPPSWAIAIRSSASTTVLRHVEEQATHLVALSLRDAPGELPAAQQRAFIMDALKLNVVF